MGEAEDITVVIDRTIEISAVNDDVGDTAIGASAQFDGNAIRISHNRSDRNHAVVVHTLCRLAQHDAPCGSGCSKSCIQVLNRKAQTMKAWFVHRTRWVGAGQRHLPLQQIEGKPAKAKVALQDPTVPEDLVEAESSAVLGPDATSQ